MSNRRISSLSTSLSEGSRSLWLHPLMLILTTMTACPAWKDCLMSLSNTAWNISLYVRSLHVIHQVSPARKYCSIYHSYCHLSLSVQSFHVLYKSSCGRPAGRYCLMYHSVLEISLWNTSLHIIYKICWSNRRLGRLLAVTARALHLSPRVSDWRLAPASEPSSERC